MDRHIWKFYYDHYTECFCHIKRITLFKNDIKLKDEEIFTLRYLDKVLRDKAYLGSLSMGTVAVTCISLLVGKGLKDMLNLKNIAFRVVIGIYGLYNLKSINQFGSHVALLSSMPWAFDVLLTATNENSFIATETRAFLNELIEADNLKRLE